MPQHIRASSAWKKAKKQHMGVSSSWKKIKAKWVGAGGVWKKCFVGELLAATLTVGSQDVFEEGNPEPIGVIIGYDSTYGPTGSLSPDTFDGLFVSIVAWQVAPGVSDTFLVITGFGADPGAGFITSVAFGPTEALTSAAGYQYSGGQATWQWSGNALGFSGSSSDSLIIS